jgi:2-keto-4-pentenoate hydratase
LLKRLRKDRIAGYKAGLTSEDIQKKFGVKSPVFGVLFASGKRGNESIIDASRFKTPMVETEVGFIIGKSVTQPINDSSDLYEHIRAVVPVIEIPDLGFEENKTKGHRY